MKKAKALGAIAGLAIIGAAATAGAAYADGQNYGTSWESGFFGAKVNGYVQIQASYDDDGRHAQTGYQRFTRPSGPSLDTGFKPTDSASDPSDPNIYSRTDWVWDSPLWGDEYVTSYYWQVDYF
ncbi:hypothetical protein [Actinomyces israelii]|jgi:hypothetical protein|uniref:hypothetical protein n=1 Tax=Actinomyces israelii TaxID=1659 RepID=UPI00235505E8|nr:hypothetical protein [Actinomyces israelii]